MQASVVTFLTGHRSICTAAEQVTWMLGLSSMDSVLKVSIRRHCLHTSDPLYYWCIGFVLFLMMRVIFKNDNKVRRFDVYIIIVAILQKEGMILEHHLW